MVSFWPWKGEDSSPASFEKALSTLSAKITATQLQLDKVRTRSRRIKVLWTLYLSFAYLVYAIVLILVVGYSNLGVWEWVGMAGGPVLIYVMRTLTHTYFTMRIETLEARLKDQQSERATTIQRLKDATKYDSTHELLEKTGTIDEPDTRALGRTDPLKNELRTSGDCQYPETALSSGRTHLDTPPEPDPPASLASIVLAHLTAAPHPAASGLHRRVRTKRRQPAAYPLPAIRPQPKQHPRWYDRILDLMLGEDETAPKNRIVLICQNCRLVNGQAPPGTKALADVGLWKCMSCGSMNGEMDEGKKIMREVLGGADTIRPSIEVTDNSDGGADEVGAQIMAEDAMATGLEERSSMGPMTRSRKSGRNKA
ncbi:uncharacterized protein PG986_010630 [Apiospora aurea]|uniref:Endoplasmic reticulum junction formation protein lunapark n=1 Tax=Apiospora aurea TaxID=335848 RepID=A0ABR1Q2T1_9PEZI